MISIYVHFENLFKKSSSPNSILCISVFALSSWLREVEVEIKGEVEGEVE
jgi:hypothetical protein